MKAQLPLKELDVRIAKALLRDGRRSFRDMGREFGVAAGTVRNRYLKLVDRGLIRVTVTMNSKSNDLALAFTLFKIAPGQSALIASKLKEQPQTEFVSELIGIYQLVAKTVHSQLSDYQPFLSKALPEPLLGYVSEVKTFWIVDSMPPDVPSA